MTPSPIRTSKRFIPAGLAPATMILALAVAAHVPAQTEKSSRAPILAWDVQTSGTMAGLRGVSAVDAETAWASGSVGTVLRTIDGGRTWTAFKVPGAETVDFRDIEAFDARTAVIMGIASPARIFRTEDGGATWTEAYRNDAAGMFLDAIGFSGPADGWAVGDPLGGRIFLLTTSDGGRTWAEVPVERRPAAAEGEGLFAASGTCLEAKSSSEVRFATGGPVSRIFHTADGGRTWAVADSPLLHGQPSYGTYSIAFRDARTGIAVGGDYRNEPAAESNAAFTTDGGRTWTVPAERRPAGFREGVVFVPGSRPALALAVGPSGSDFSLDDGRTWTPIPGPAGFHALSFARDGSAGWAVGKNGLIARIHPGR
ncbi:MAG: YCF48-related protein [Acidobacteriota bacterium]|nr:YCF48-related protein [Acidobacteriota bacterium]